MAISGITPVGYENLPSSAALENDGLQQTIGIAVMKKDQEAEKKMANALVEMMQQNTPKATPSGTGSVINIGA